MNEERAVCLEHEQPRGLRQYGGESTAVSNLAAGDDQAHAGTVLSASDTPEERVLTLRELNRALLAAQEMTPRVSAATIAELSRVVNEAAMEAPIQPLRRLSRAERAEVDEEGERLRAFVADD